MNESLKCIMLIDDNDDDNFFHERAIKKFNPENIVIIKTTGIAALAYLKSLKNRKEPHPDLIFLDVNMPGMNGWDFLQEYNVLDKQVQSQAIIIMLTTSENSNDRTKAKAWALVTDYITKPLTAELLKDINSKYFNTVLKA